MPCIDELFDQLRGNLVFSNIDLWSRYHWIIIKEEHRPKISFRIRFGHYVFIIEPFWLTNAPKSFMNLMNSEFKKCLDHFFQVFLDDILIYSQNE
jgi:hypothetical protein